ncbi:sugar transferase [Pseudonocardia sp.]|uniref:sugar transferase n=1 Tax=Pseudonocardia sp. TaxID=60912 RepID=UPI0026129ABE|nr:sugar transferase [Pseudonocardia sp.]
MTSHLGLGKAASRTPVPDGGRGPSAARGVDRAEPLTVRDRWQTRYTVATIANDVVAVLVSVLLGYRLGLGSVIPQFGDVAPGVGVLAGALILFGLVIGRAWDPHVLGQGSEEFSRVIRAVVTAAVVLGLLSLAFEATAARPWVFGLMPLAGALAVAGRFVLRSRLHRMRARGRCALPVLAVGTVDSVTDLIDRTRRDTKRGWVISGICTPTGVADAGGADILGVPVLGDLDSVAETARRGGHRVVAVCPTPGWTSRRLHQLAWSIEDLTAELVVDPGLMDVAGPRLHVDPVDGLPLLRLTRPTFTGVPWVAKHIMDRLGSALLLLLAAPLVLAIAIAVKLDGGPVFFRQTRVGRHGREFSMLKFRSMIVDAEQQLSDLVTHDEGAGPLFKMRRDPRITRVGALLRRFSLDELPQLVNVLGGSMSLVGPRPPLPREVATYGREASRRLLVKPGLTGLWQISGRSDLSWEQSVRLDLRYVENWNLALDALILWRTFGAVVSSRGAY